jgi:hypothetical protein
LANEPDKLLTDIEIHDLFKGLNVVKLIVLNRDDTFSDLTKNVDNIYNNYPSINANNYNTLHLYKHTERYRVAYGIFDQLYVIDMCDQLRCAYEAEHKFKYDWVMKTRFDVIYLSTPNFSNFKPNCIYAGLGGFKQDIIGRNFPDEVIGIGDSNTMKIYSQRINEVISGKTSICAHASLHYVLNTNPQIDYIPFVFEYCILRSPNLVHYFSQQIAVDKLDSKMYNIIRNIN